MTCDQVRHLLVEQFDRAAGPLPPDRAAALRAHVQTCAACRRLDRTAGQGLAGLATLPPIAPNPRVREAV